MEKTKKSIVLIGLFVTEENKHLILRSSADRLAELFQKHNIPVISTSAKVGRLPRLFDTVLTLINRRRDYDIVVMPIFGGLSLVLESILTRVLKMLNKKVILVMRGGAIPEKMITQSKYYIPVLRRCHVIVSPSGFIQSDLKKYGLESIFIQNVINLLDYKFNDKKIFRPRLFWMRTFEDVYNPEMAVRVAAIMLKRYPDFKMVMAGHDKGSLQMVKDLAKTLQVEDKIIFQGYIQNDEKNKLAEELDFYICTNRIDNAPVSLTEVMALGMPIVTVNSGGIPFLVTHNENALMVPLDDDMAMADALSSIIENPELGYKLVKNGLEYSRSFGEEPVMKKWKNLFDQLGFSQN